MHIYHFNSNIICIIGGVEMSFQLKSNRKESESKTIFREMHKGL